MAEAVLASQSADPRLQRLLDGLTAVRGGDFSTRLPHTGDPLMDEIAAVFNSMTDQLALFTDEVTRVAREVGTEGKLGGQAQVPGVAGTWKDLTESVNAMAGNLTGQVRDIAQVATAVARGDLTQKITVDVKGEMLALKDTLNTMVDQLSAFADEVTRVAREVGTEGSLGGQAQVPGVGGTWRDLTDSVNFMAGNLTSQVRNIALVTTAVAQGDLSKKIDVDARGEILELKTTINTMVDQLSSFAAEVTRVAREVGSKGRLGGQAEVEGVSGTWKRLTENVNELAGNLTRQVRAIAEVTSAVATGDLTRSISVEAEGEVAELKDNINAMVQSLRETTKANQEQYWLKTNLARISGLMQGHRDLATVAELIMDELIPLVGAQHGTFFIAGDTSEGTILRLAAGYGLQADIAAPSQFRLGQSLIGQVAKTRKPIIVTDAPPDYVRISSGLGDGAPVNLIVLPIVFEGQVLGVIEAGSFSRFTQVHQDFLEQLMETIRQRDPLIGVGPAAADQRHPGPVPGGGRQAGCAPRAVRARVAGRGPADRVRAARGREEARVRGGVGTGRARRGRHRPAAAPTGAAQPAVQRGQVHPAGPGAAADPPGDFAGPRGRGWPGLLGVGHRDRHLRRQPEDDLRGVPAGRRHHQPPLRRHRPGAGDQP